MTEKKKKYLSDILTSITFIEEFSSGITSFDQYSKDFKTKSAIERQLGIIGEAINKFLRNSPDVSISGAKQIINLRNRLIHSYDNIDDSIIWAILTRHLLPLKEEIQELLKD